ncbi:MAG: NADH:ubiquinone oxidoreductase subunit 6 (subunit J) [Candidatus Latescibacterota bacterium]
MESFFFFPLAFCTVVAALVLITCRQPLYGALALVAATMGIAGLCALLGVPVLGAATLFIMGSIGLLCAFFTTSLRVELTPADSRRDSTPYIATFFALLLVVQFMMYSQVEGKVDEPTAIASVTAIASTLFADYLLPLHIVVLLLLCAMVGTLTLTRARKQES